jgi:hypothetical protein
LAPFTALYEREVRLPVEVQAGEPVGRLIDSKCYAKELLENMPKIRRIVREDIVAAQDRQKTPNDKKHRDLQFNVGDLV